ncbi:hypothetical protein QQX98_008697 [Neonectria punicea]|uniref:Uncharacterized protein n=1 Tax=Neonectria punicea TaxID=979145 RepID=A0ABR1GUM7_9HYPO
MPNTYVLRLYVSVSIHTTPLTLEIGFPKGRKKLAELYRNSVQRAKTLPKDHQKPLSVVFELPPSAKSIDTNKGVQSLVVHFDCKDSADAWTDTICQNVKGHERHVIVKQYWEEGELEELEKKLEELEKQGEQERKLKEQEKKLDDQKRKLEEQKKKLKEQEKKVEEQEKKLEEQKRLNR